MPFKTYSVVVLTFDHCLSIWFSIHFSILFSFLKDILYNFNNYAYVTVREEPEKVKENLFIKMYDGNNEKKEERMASFT